MSYKLNLFDCSFLFSIYSFFYFPFNFFFLGGGVGMGYHNYSFSLATKRKTLKTFSTIVLQFSYF